MIHTIIIGIFAVILTYLNKYKNFRYGLELAFILITIFLAIRYDWGNDYNSYLDIYNSINSIDYNFFDISFIKSNNTYELGWVILNIVFKPLGFFSLIIFLTIIQHFIIYSFIKEYVPKQWQWFAIFIYIFSANFMLTGCSMIRQFFSICIFIYSIKFIILRKPIYFTILIIFASLFHTSAIILYPTYFFTLVKGNYKKIYNLPFVLFIIIWLIYGSKLMSENFNFIMGLSIFEKYNIYVDNSFEFTGTGVGILFNLLILVTCLYNINKFNEKLRVFIYIYGLSFIFIPLLSFGALIGRLTFYFSILTIIIVPNLLQIVKYNLIRYLLFTCYTLLIIKGFIDFFYSDVWHESFINYKTIFSASQWI